MAFSVVKSASLNRKKGQEKTWVHHLGKGGLNWKISQTKCLTISFKQLNHLAKDLLYRLISNITLTKEFTFKLDFFLSSNKSVV